MTLKAHWLHEFCSMSIAFILRLSAGLWKTGSDLNGNQVEVTGANINEVALFSPGLPE
jgi:hypothetical protein